MNCYLAMFQLFYICNSNNVQFSIVMKKITVNLYTAGKYKIFNLGRGELLGVFFFNV